MKELAHSLKGAARSACANKLGNISASLQIKSEEKIQSKELIQEIVQEFENVKKEIETL
jgi:HPt (histidine-containing phosphotransfer) domain-containing protein